MSYSHYQGKNRSVLWLSRQPPQHELALLCIRRKKLNPFQNAEEKHKLSAMNNSRPDLGLFIFSLGIFKEQKLFYGGKCLSCKKCKMDGVVFVIYLFCAMPTLISAAWQKHHHLKIILYSYHRMHVLKFLDQATLLLMMSLSVKLIGLCPAWDPVVTGQGRAGTHTLSEGSKNWAY